MYMERKKQGDCSREFIMVRPTVLLQSSLSPSSIVEGWKKKVFSKSHYVKVPHTNPCF